MRHLHVHLTSFTGKMPGGAALTLPQPEDPAVTSIISDGHKVRFMVGSMEDSVNQATSWTSYDLHRRNLLFKSNLNEIS